MALVSHGDSNARDSGTLGFGRLQGLAAALRAIGVEPSPLVYNDDFADEVRQQLLDMDGALVWVNPIEDGHDRTCLDSLLAEVSAAGGFVSAEPNVILAMGTKEVLVHTRHMSWGSDVQVYSSLRELREQLPIRLAAAQVRVLKQYRGNGGNGVWKVHAHLSDEALICVRHALRNGVEEIVTFDEFMARCSCYFSGEGRIIDQAYQDRLVEGMIRCYLSGDEVVGFGHQEINALYPAQPGGSSVGVPQPGPRLYHPPSNPRFRPIKNLMEDEWLPGMCQALNVDRHALPVIWDADLLLGPRDSNGEDTYVLCEINVSSVFPFPDDALEPIANLTKERLAARRSKAGTRKPNCPGAATVGEAE